MPEAATIEAPTETKTPPPATHPGSVTIDLGNLGKKSQPVEKKEVAAVEAVVKEVEKADPVALAKEVAAKKPNDKEHNLAELRKAREAAEAARKSLEEEHTKLKADFEALQKKAPELPEDVKEKLTKAEQREKEYEEMRQTLRQADLSRDPEFIAKYNKPITEHIKTMGQTALGAGVTEADWSNAVANWDENQFAEWREAMTPVQRVKFDAAWTSAVSLHQQQQIELKDADAAYQELQKKRQADQEAQQKQYFTQNEQLAKSVIAETIKPETFKEHEDLAPAVENMLQKAARHELSAKDIFQQLAANQVLARVTVKQKSRIDELEAQLAERDKKISEQDAFIANQAGAVPRGDAAGTPAGSNGKSAPLWQNIVVKAPG